MVAKIDNGAKVDIPTNHYINPCHIIQGLKSFASNQVKFDTFCPFGYYLEKFTKINDFQFT